MSTPTATTKDTILDAAEELFAENGYAATSLRQLTAAAGVNLAAVNYHFGSKEDLAKAVLERRIAPINAARLRRLDEMGKRRSLEKIVRAFIEPPLMTSVAGPNGAAPGCNLSRVFGRISVEQPPFLRAFLAQQFRDVARRFQSELAAVLPACDAATLWWRLHFTVGAMAHTLQNAHTFAHLTNDVCDASDVAGLAEHLIAFAIGGLRARAPKRTAAAHSARAKARRARA
jgi:AcrR family transcriptional regulator